MSSKYLLSLFWYIVWFAALPAVIAWKLVEFFVRIRFLSMFEEFEFWHVLLLFALLAFITYSLRDKLPFWQISDADHPFRIRRRRKEAARLLENVRKIMTAYPERIQKKGKVELDTAVAALEAALKENADADLTTAATKLSEVADKHPAFAKKSGSREYFESIGVAVLVAVVLRLFVLEAFKIPSESMVPTLMVGDHIFVSKYRYGLSLPFINKRIVRFAKPKYGEVVVFVKPGIADNPTVQYEGDEADMAGTDFIKRIIGLPGDTVEMREDAVYVNGKKLPRCLVGTRTYRTRTPFENTWRDGKAELWVEKHGEFTYAIAESIGGDRYKYSFSPIHVPQDRVFVLGDNRDNSNDSRYWGTVPLDNIKGRAMVIWWSNRRPHGFQWDRVGTFIMSDPELSDKQQEALAQCKNMR